VSEDSKKWVPRDFSRRSYGIEDTKLDSAKRISVTVKVDGKVVADVQLREPGMVAVVSRPDDQGFDIELVEPGGVRFTDFSTPDGERRTLAVTDWQLEALGLKQ